MNINKAILVKNITIKSLISSYEASILLESFLLLIKNQVKKNPVKLSGFGTFSIKKTPKRIGRNPKNGDSYIIPELRKLKLSPSNKAKEKIN
jgi:integration host factor subunit alpha